MKRYLCISDKFSFILVLNYSFLDIFRDLNMGFAFEILQ